MTEPTSPDPVGELDHRFGSPDAAPTTWAEAWQRLADAEIYWLTTVRRNGQPHVAPLIGIVLDHSVYVTTGLTEQKALNLAANPRCVVMTGDNRLGDGLDIVVEGAAELVKDEATLQALAAAFKASYPPFFHFEPRDGSLTQGGEPILTYGIRPSKILAFGRGDTYSQTRWRL